MHVDVVTRSRTSTNFAMLLHMSVANHDNCTGVLAAVVPRVRNYESLGHRLIPHPFNIRPTVPVQDL